MPSSRGMNLDFITSTPKWNNQSPQNMMHSPEQFYNVGGALSEFRDPKIVERVPELAVSDEVRNQDAAGLIARY